MLNIWAAATIDKTITGIANPIINNCLVDILLVAFSSITNANENAKIAREIEIIGPIGIIAISDGNILKIHAAATSPVAMAAIIKGTINNFFKDFLSKVNPELLRPIITPAIAYDNGIIIKPTAIAVINWAPLIPPAGNICNIHAEATTAAAIEIIAAPPTPTICMIPVIEPEPIEFPVILSNINLPPLLAKAAVIAKKTGVSTTNKPATAIAVTNCPTLIVGIILRILVAATIAAAIETITKAPLAIPMKLGILIFFSFSVFSFLDVCSFIRSRMFVKSTVCFANSFAEKSAMFLRSVVNRDIVANTSFESSVIFAILCNGANNIFI